MKFSDLIFWRRKPKADHAPPPIPPPPWTGMTLDRWRESLDMIEFAGALFRDPRFHRIMEVLWSMQPIAPLNRETDAGMQLGRIQGYRECLAVLMELPKPPAQEQRDVPIDYSGDTFETVEQS